MMQGHAYLCGLILLVLGQTGYGSRPRRDDGLIMKVTTIEDHPYMMVKNPSKSGNDNFEGFIPDLLNEISDNIRVGYNLELVADNRYGENQGGQWTGMVGALAKKDPFIMNAEDQASTYWIKDSAAPIVFDSYNSSTC